jgi:alpha-aminoadipate carrier protein LysW
MQNSCIDCGVGIDLPEDTLNGEIISCPDCGTDYFIESDGNGGKSMKELVIEGEDWGE